MCWDLVYLSYKACQYLSYQAKAKKKKKVNLGRLQSRLELWGREGKKKRKMQYLP